VLPPLWSKAAMNPAPSRIFSNCLMFMSRRSSDMAVRRFSVAHFSQGRGTQAQKKWTSVC
jgi:hypothetical protein